MTSPIPMPFSAELAPRNTFVDLLIASEHRQDGYRDSLRIPLPSGVSTVQMTWTGPQQVTANYYTGETTAIARPGVGVLPAGTGTRTTTFQVSSPDSEGGLEFSTPTSLGAESPHRLAVVVIPIPPAGTI